MPPITIHDDDEIDYGLPERRPSPSLLDSSDQPDGFFDPPPSREVLLLAKGKIKKKEEKVEIIDILDDDDDDDDLVVLDVKKEEPFEPWSDDDDDIAILEGTDAVQFQPARSTNRPPLERPSVIPNDAQTESNSDAVAQQRNFDSIPKGKENPAPQRPLPNPEGAGAPTISGSQRGESVSVVNRSTLEQPGTEANLEINSHEHTDIANASTARQKSVDDTTTSSTLSSDKPQQININISKSANLRVVIDGKEVVFANLSSSTGTAGHMNPPAPPPRNPRSSNLSTSIDCQTGPSIINGEEVVPGPNIDLSAPGPLRQKRVSEPCQTGPSLINGEILNSLPNVDLSSPTRFHQATALMPEGTEKNSPMIDIQHADRPRHKNDENQKYDDSRKRDHRREERRDLPNKRDRRSRSRSRSRSSRRRSPSPRSHHSRNHYNGDGDRHGRRQSDNGSRRGNHGRDNHDRYIENNLRRHNLRENGVASVVRSFHNPAELIQHIKKCEQCNKTFRSRRTSADHQKQKHNRKHCPVCFRLFDWSGHTWKNHLLEHHAVNRTEMAKCCLCDQTFNFEGLYTHISKVHLVPFERERELNINMDIFDGNPGRHRTPIIPTPTLPPTLRLDRTYSSSAAPVTVMRNKAFPATITQRSTAPPSTHRRQEPQTQRGPSRAPAMLNTNGGLNSNIQMVLDAKRVNGSFKPPEILRPTNTRLNQPPLSKRPPPATISNRIWNTTTGTQRPGFRPGEAAVSSANQMNKQPITNSRTKDTKLSAIQMHTLNIIYNNLGHPPESEESRRLSDQLGVEIEVIITWFRNKHRTKCQERKEWELQKHKK